MGAQRDRVLRGSCTRSSIRARAPCANEGFLLTEKHVAGVPELVIEIGSPGTRKRDETLKRRLYERTGVDEYWVVDPAVDVIRVFRRAGEKFDRPTELSTEAGDTLTTPILPGLEISLAWVFV